MLDGAAERAQASGVRARIGLGLGLGLATSYPNPNPNLKPSPNPNPNPHRSPKQAVVSAMLPGPYGGAAVAEVLLGATNPSARLPLTYPRYAGLALQHWHKVTRPCIACGPLRLGLPLT